MYNSFLVETKRNVKVFKNKKKKKKNNTVKFKNKNKQKKKKKKTDVLNAFHLVGSTYVYLRQHAC
jgi:hypothetical protein